MSKMDSKMTISLKELSQVLVVVRIFASQEEQILTTVKNLFASPEVIKESEFHEEPTSSINHLCQSMEETKDSWTISIGEKSLEPEIEEHSPCLSTNLVCILETNHPQEDNQVNHGMIMEHFQSGTHEEVNQEHHDYIEHWF